MYTFLDPEMLERWGNSKKKRWLGRPAFDMGAFKMCEKCCANEDTDEVNVFRFGQLVLYDEMCEERIKID
jgi:hypothetical protein